MFSVGCLLLGHDDMMVRTPDRLWLRCQHCARDTSGWTIGPETTLVHQVSHTCPSYLLQNATMIARLVRRG